MAREKKALEGAEKAQAEWVAPFFASVPLPVQPATSPTGGDGGTATVGRMTRSPELNAKIREAATKLHAEFSAKRAALTKEQKADSKNYPPLKPSHFPDFVYFSAYMTEQYKESLAIWEKRFETGKMNAAEAKDQTIKKLHKKLEQAKAFLESMKSMGLDIDLGAIAKQLGLASEQITNPKAALEAAKAAPAVEDSSDEDAAEQTDGVVEEPEVPAGADGDDPKF